MPHLITHEKPNNKSLGLGLDINNKPFWKASTPKVKDSQPIQITLLDEKNKVRTFKIKKSDDITLVCYECKFTTKRNCPKVKYKSNEYLLCEALGENIYFE